MEEGERGPWCFLYLDNRVRWIQFSKLKLSEAYPWRCTENGVKNGVEECHPLEKSVLGRHT